MYIYICMYTNIIHIGVQTSTSVGFLEIRGGLDSRRAPPLLRAVWSTSKIRCAFYVGSIKSNDGQNMIVVIRCMLHNKYICKLYIYIYTYIHIYIYTYM